MGGFVEGLYEGGRHPVDFVRRTSHDEKIILGAGEDFLQSALGAFAAVYDLRIFSLKIVKATRWQRWQIRLRKVKV
jgi:hypothetical protein